jgi:hypothetical protein
VRRLDTLWRVLIMPVPFTAVVMLIAGRWLIPVLWHHQVLDRPCLFRAWSGLPCPLCGGTRALVLAAHGDWLGSLQMNPAAAMLAAGLVVTGIWCTVCAVTGLDLGITTSVAWLRRRCSWAAVIAALLLLLLWLARLCLV